MFLNDTNNPQKFPGRGEIDTPEHVVQGSEITAESKHGILK